MIAVTNILESTRDKLKSLKDIPVYLDEVKESFKSPCFFLKTIKTTVPEKEFLYKTQLTLYITYYAKKGHNSALELLAIKDLVNYAFAKGIFVDDSNKNKRYLRFASIENETIGKDADIVEFTLRTSYLERMHQENPELIRDVYVNENLI